ncbi:unnamed protein product, partial [Musa acuminata subsp. burmannicoides]
WNAVFLILVPCSFNYLACSQSTEEHGWSHIPDLAFTRFIPIVASWFTSVDLRDANANFGCKQIRRRF